MTTGWKIAIGLGVAGTLGYVYYRYSVAPVMAIYILNPLDGSGQFSWGSSSGSIGPGTVIAGWGWSASFAGFTPGQGWSVMVFKNGALYRQMTINSVGTINI